MRLESKKKEKKKEDLKIVLDFNVVGELGGVFRFRSWPRILLAAVQMEVVRTL